MGNFTSRCRSFIRELVLPIEPSSLHHTASTAEAENMNREELKEMKPYVGGYLYFGEPSHEESKVVLINPQLMADWHATINASLPEGMPRFPTYNQYRALSAEFDFFVIQEGYHKFALRFDGHPNLRSRCIQHRKSEVFFKEFPLSYSGCMCNWGDLKDTDSTVFLPEIDGEAIKKVPVEDDFIALNSASAFHQQDSLLPSQVEASTQTVEWQDNWPCPFSRENSPEYQQKKELKEKRNSQIRVQADVHHVKSYRENLNELGIEQMTSLNQRLSKSQDPI